MLSVPFLIISEAAHQHAIKKHCNAHPVAWRHRLDKAPLHTHLHIAAVMNMLGYRCMWNEVNCGIKEPQGDRMARLFKHILQQRHMYPVFPPALNSCVDWHHSKHLEMKRIPNILVLPSPLPPCAKLVDLPTSGSTPGEQTPL
jgi:hypothetical protein